MWWWEGITEWRVFDSWNARGSILFLKLFHSPIFFVPFRAGHTKTTQGNMSRSGVCAFRGDANIYIVTRPQHPTCPSIIGAIGPINRSNNVLARTCHEKNKSETCFAFFLTAVMAVLSNLWLPTSLVLQQGRKPKRRKRRINKMTLTIFWFKINEKKEQGCFYVLYSICLFFIYQNIMRNYKNM